MCYCGKGKESSMIVSVQTNQATWGGMPARVRGRSAGDFSEEAEVSQRQSGKEARGSTSGRGKAHAKALWWEGRWPGCKFQAEIGGAGSRQTLPASGMNV